MGISDVGHSPERVKFKRGQHPASQKNLKPFPKGSNGGLNSKGYSLTAALKHALANDAKRQELVESTLAGAILREPTPFKEVWERLEGKVPEQHDVNVESRVLQVIVMDQRTADLLGLMGERAKKLIGGENNVSVS